MEEDAVVLPRPVWSRSRRPLAGVALRWSSSLALALFGFAFGVLPLRLAFLVLGVVTFIGVPWVADVWFERLGRRMAAVPRSDATRILGGLEARRSVALFAPYAWVQLQKGRLHLILGDGRAAARSFAEAARLCGDPKQPALLGAQAHALTRSGDRKAARELLVELEQEGRLAARDRLNLGIAMLEDAGRSDGAVQQLEAAREQLGTTPLVAAALGLAYARAGRADEAERALEAAGAVEVAATDLLYHDLLKRARKVLRQARSTEDRRTRKAAAGQDPESASQSSRGMRRAKRKAAKDKKAGKKARHASKPAPLPAAPASVKEERAVEEKLGVEEAKPAVEEKLGVEEAKPAVEEKLGVEEAKPAVEEKLPVEDVKAPPLAESPVVPTSVPVPARLPTPSLVPAPPPVVPKPTRLSADDAWADLIAGDEDVGPA